MCTHTQFLGATGFAGAAFFFCLRHARFGWARVIVGPLHGHNLWRLRDTAICGAILLFFEPLLGFAVGTRGGCGNLPLWSKKAPLARNPPPPQLLPLALFHLFAALQPMAKRGEMSEPDEPAVGMGTKETDPSPAVKAPERKNKSDGWHSQIKATARAGRIPPKNKNDTSK